MPSLSRRGALRASAALFPVLAGCTSSCPDGDGPTPETVVRPGDDPAGAVAPGTDWLSLRHDPRNTGYGSDAVVPTDAVLAWRTDVPAAGAGTPAGPVLADSLYVVDGDGTLRALDPADGRERWTADVTPAVGPPTVADGLVVVAGPDGVHAVDVAEHAVRWRDEGLAATAPATVGDGRAFVPGEGTLVALDAASGERLWTASFDGPVTRPALADGTVLAAGSQVYALDTADGRERWVGGAGDASLPVVADGTVYVGTFEGLHAFGLDAGDRRWQFSRGDGRGFGAPVVTPDTLYAVELLGEGPGAVYALDPDSGEPEPRWCSYLGEGRVSAAGPEGILVGMPAGEGPGAGHAVQAFDRETGRATWQFRSDRRVGSPALADGVAYLLTADGAVCAVGGGGA